MMSETLTLPVLPLDDDVVLPGMVVPIALSDTEVRGAVEAARNRNGLARGFVLKRNPKYLSSPEWGSAAWRPSERWPS